MQIPGLSPFLLSTSLVPTENAPRKNPKNAETQAVKQRSLGRLNDLPHWTASSTGVVTDFFKAMPTSSQLPAAAQSVNARDQRDQFYAGVAAAQTLKGPLLTLHVMDLVSQSLQLAPQLRAAALVNLLSAIEPLEPNFKAWALSTLIANSRSMPEAFEPLLRTCLLSGERVLLEQLVPPGKQREEVLDAVFASLEEEHSVGSPHISTASVARH